MSSLVNLVLGLQVSECNFLFKEDHEDQSQQWSLSEDQKTEDCARFMKT